MAESYSERTSTAAEGGRFDDRTFRLIGMAVSGIFAFAVIAFMALIVLFVDPQLFVSILPEFFTTLGLVIGIVIAGSVLSIVAGVLVGLGRVSKTGLTHTIASGYVEFFRGTPLLFQLIVIYYGIPAFWPPGEFPITRWAIPAALIGLTLNHAAYIGEAIRGGIEAVPRGQMEAARSLGMSYVQSMREVILPQAWRNALAAIGNDLVILVKDTSLLTVIAIPELISYFQNIYSSTFDPWTPLVLIAIGYLMITIPLGQLVQYAENRADPAGGHR
jgi:polar amino acid transport system permease protein